MLQERESSASKRVSHSKILVQPKMNLSYSFFLIIVFNLFEFREFFFLSSTLNMRFLEGVRESGAYRCHVSTLAALEAKSLLDALLSFFWSEFLWEFDCINIHGIGISSCSRGRRERLESLSRPSTLLNNLLCMILLILEVGCF